MATLFTMKAQLALIRSQLPQLAVFSSGRSDSDDQADKESEALERMAQQLQLILRDLKSSAHLAQVQLDTIRKVPLEDRYSAKQSADQKRRDVAALAAEAEALKSEVLDLLQKNGTITPFQATQKTMDLIKDLQEHLPMHEKMATHQSTGVAYEPMPSPSGEAHFDTVVPLVTLVYLLVKKVKQRYQPKSK